MDRFFFEARDSCRGKNWLPRLPLLLGFAYILLRHWSNPEYADILFWLNWGIHELGHLIFSPFGQFLHVVGGTFAQCVAPLYGVINFYRQKEFFGIALCFGWMSTSLFNMATYVADARKMILPMAVPFYSGGDVIHDWNYLLSHMNLLKYNIALAVFIKFLASIFMFICLGFGIWLFKQMMDRAPKEQ